jgi:hypothetical protein
MPEALAVFGVVIALLVLGVVAIVLPIETLAMTGGACILVGFLIGIPAGIYYHYVLYRCLATRGKVPSGFVWHPTSYHGQLRGDELRRVRPWFLTGAACFGLIMLGSTLCMLGFLRV